MKENILFIDTETTGLDKNSNGLLQIYAEFHQEGQPKSHFNQKVTHNYVHSNEPEKDVVIDIGALRVNNTSMKTLYKSSPDNRLPEIQVLRNFVDFLLELPKEEITIAGHNVHFDLEFIKTRLAKYNITGLDRIFSYRVLDTATIGEFFRRAGVLKMNKTSLENLANSLNISTIDKNLHDAKTDVEITAEAYYTMLKMVKQLSTLE